MTTGLFTTLYTQYVLSTLQDQENTVRNAKDMTPSDISDELLQALRKLEQDGKDLTNGWDVAQISFSGITGGQYEYGYGHGGPSDLVDTVVKMCKIHSSGRVDPLVLQRVIQGIKLTLTREEFTGDPKLYCSRAHLALELQSLTRLQAELPK